jgi:hypothetical protein
VVVVLGKVGDVRGFWLELHATEARFYTPARAIIGPPISISPGTRSADAGQLSTELLITHAASSTAPRATHFGRRVTRPDPDSAAVAQNRIHSRTVRTDVGTPSRFLRPALSDSSINRARSELRRARYMGNMDSHGP